MSADAGDTGRVSTRGALIALAFFSLLAVACFAPAWSSGPRDFAVANGRTLTGGAQKTNTLMIGDTTFVAARVRRNAIGLLEAPHKIFRREMCYPATGTLVVADPMVTAGLLGIPGHVMIGGAAGPTIRRCSSRRC